MNFTVGIARQGRNAKVVKESRIQETFYVPSKKIRPYFELRMEKLLTENPT